MKIRLVDILRDFRYDLSDWLYYKTVAKLNLDKNNRYWCSPLYQKYTGLRNIIRYDYWDMWREISDIPVIQVQNDYSEKLHRHFFCLTIEDEPRIVYGKCRIKKIDLAEVKRFIKDNREDLLVLSDSKRSGFHDDEEIGFLRKLTKV